MLNRLVLPTHHGRLNPIESWVDSFTAHDCPSLPYDEPENVHEEVPPQKRSPETKNEPREICSKLISANIRHLKQNLPKTSTFCHK